MQYREIVNSYKEERQSLLEANWNLSQRVNELEAIKQDNEREIAQLKELLAKAEETIDNIEKITTKKKVYIYEEL